MLVRSCGKVEGRYRNRFGSQNQTERFRAELNTRRRAKGESLQSVYQDIRQLIALSFPKRHGSEAGSIYEILARDAFLTAIDNPSIRRRILERDPPQDTLDATLSAAVRLEALDASEAVLHPPTLDDQPSNQRKQVRGIAAEDDRVRKLETKFDSAMAEMRKQVSDATACAEQWRLQALACMSTQPVARDRDPRTLSLQPGSAGLSDANQGRDWKAPGGTNRGRGEVEFPGMCANGAWKKDIGPGSAQIMLLSSQQLLVQMQQFTLVKFIQLYPLQTHTWKSQ